MNTVTTVVTPICPLPYIGAYFNAEELFKKTLIHMRTKTGYNFKYDYPISLTLSDSVGPDGELVYVDGFMHTFTLGRQDMMVAAGWMIQKLFPSMSWKRSWKRTDGRHAHWLTTEELTKFVTFNSSYQRLQFNMLVGFVDTELLNEFAFFRNWVSAHGGDVPPSQVILSWVHTVFMVSELARELEYNTNRKTYMFSVGG